MNPNRKQWQRLILCLVLAEAMVSGAGCVRRASFYQPMALWSETTTDYVVALTGQGPDHEAQRATGTVFVETPFKGPEGVSIRFSCGVTFISPHSAVTAAHCLPDLSDQGRLTRVDTVQVQMYRMPQDLKWQAALHLSGNYPQWTHPPIPHYEDYVDTFTCRVKVRCSVPADGPPIQCDDPKHQKTDIALIRCDTPVTSKGYTYLPVAERDDPNLPPYLRWTHELYQSADNPQDLSEHYVYREDFVSNIHYWGLKNGVPFNQWLPLASSDATKPNPHHKVPLKPGETSDPNTRRTDIPVCHGASGSGVLQLNPCSNRYELLGVIHAAAQAGRVPKLCSSSGSYSYYTQLDHIKYLATFAKGEGL